MSHRKKKSIESIEKRTRKKKHNLSWLTAETIKPYLKYDQKIAAEKLKVSISTLKRHFYKLSIGRWPIHRPKSPNYSSRDIIESDEDHSDEEEITQTPANTSKWSYFGRQAFRNFNQQSNQRIPTYYNHLNYFSRSVYPFAQKMIPQVSQIAKSKVVENERMGKINHLLLEKNTSNETVKNLDQSTQRFLYSQHRFNFNHLLTKGQSA